MTTFVTPIEPASKGLRFHHARSIVILCRSHKIVYQYRFVSRALNSACSDIDTGTMAGTEVSLEALGGARPCSC